MGTLTKRNIDYLIDRLKMNLHDLKMYLYFRRKKPPELFDYKDCIEIIITEFHTYEYYNKIYLKRLEIVFEKIEKIFYRITADCEEQFSWLVPDSFGTLFNILNSKEVVKDIEMRKLMTSTTLRNDLKGLLDGMFLLQETISDASMDFDSIITDYDTPNTIKPKRKKNKSKQTFESLFRNTDVAKKVVKIFKTREYIKDGVWKGLSENKTELLAAYYVLKPLLKPGKITTQARIFYQNFGLYDLEEKYVDERNFTNEPFNKDRDEFESIFTHLLNL